MASQDVIRRLLDAGANYETIGQAVGRNRSLIRQVGIGAKPGRNLEAALTALEQRLAGVEPGRVNTEARRSAGTLPAPAQRVNRRGALAKVRRPTTVRGRGWSSSTMKRQAMRNGGRGLGHPIADAAEAGQQVAATITLGSGLAAEHYGTSRRGQAGAGGSLDILLGDADEVLAEIQDGYGGNVSAYLADVMVARGLVSVTSGGATGEELREHAEAGIEQVELRAFNG